MHNLFPTTNIVDCSGYWRSCAAYDISYDSAIAEAFMHNNWAISECMTIAGDCDWCGAENDRQKIAHTIEKSTHFGWEARDWQAWSDGDFALYEDDWTPKDRVREFDNLLAAGWVQTPLADGYDTVPTPTVTPTPPFDTPDLFVMKDFRGVNENYGYRTLEVGDSIYWDCASRNPRYFSKDRWIMPSEFIYKIDGFCETGNKIAVVKGRPQTLYIYNAPRCYDDTIAEAIARNPSYLAQDSWAIGGGNDIIAMADAGNNRLAILKNESGDYNIYLYNRPLDGDSSYEDAMARNPSALARDFWFISGGNNTIDIAGLDSNGDGNIDYLGSVKNQSGNHELYIYNLPAPGDYTYWDSNARNPSPIAKDLWVIPSGNNVAAIVGFTPPGSYEDKLLVMKKSADFDFDLYYYNCPVPGDWSEEDANMRNPSPGYYARDLWSIPSWQGRCDGMAAPSKLDPTVTATLTPTVTNSPTNTPTINTPTKTPSATNTPTLTPTVTNTPTLMPTATRTVTETPTSINTSTPTPTITHAPTPFVTTTPLMVKVNFQPTYSIVPDDYEMDDGSPFGIHGDYGWR